MTYDMHGSWEFSTADHHAPLYKRSWETVNNNIDYIIKYYVQLGASPSKLIMGIPLYGRSWTLTSSQTNPPAPAAGAGAAAPFTAEAGYIGYSEICGMVRSNTLTVAQDPNKQTGPYAYSLTTKFWVAYDDVAMAVVKSNYALSNGLGGAMVWDVSMDDFCNTCGAGTNPLISAIYQTITRNTPTTTTAPSTVFSTTIAPTTTPSKASSTTTSTTTIPTTSTTSKPCASYVQSLNTVQLT